jgi:hypothetical protein
MSEKEKSPVFIAAAKKTDDFSVRQKIEAPGWNATRENTRLLT